MTALFETPTKAPVVVDLRNVYKRKLAVMAKCDGIKPDAQYGQEGGKVHFPYLSVQYISNQIRKFAVEEGLDVTCSVAGDLVIVVMTNVDDPKEQITATWPLVPQDKAWAYSTKYALIRTFLIGDGEEGDEAENAKASGQPRAATQRWAERPKTGEGSACMRCSELGFTSTTGAPPTFRKSKRGNFQCNGRTDEIDAGGERGWANHPMPLAEGEESADETAIPFS